jgi:hypothetical protein
VVLYFLMKVNIRDPAYKYQRAIADIEVNISDDQFYKMKNIEGVHIQYKSIIKRTNCSSIWVNYLELIRYVF